MLMQKIKICKFYVRDSQNKVVKMFSHYFHVTCYFLFSCYLLLFVSERKTGRHTMQVDTKILILLVIVFGILNEIML